MNQHLSEGTLSSEAAQKLAGRLGFVAFAVLGPLGASHVNHLYRRCYESKEVMSSDLEQEVRWWCNCLSRNKRVTIPLSLLGGGPIVLYTDAEGYGGTGAVLSINGDVQWMRSHVRSFFQKHSVRLSKRVTQIIPYEAIAVLQALCTWRHSLIGKQVLLFIDNTSVLGCVRKGRSRSEDVHEIIALILYTLESANIKAFAHWVPSALNVADVPSRGLPLPFGEEVRCRT